MHFIDVVTIERDKKSISVNETILDLGLRKRGITKLSASSIRTISEIVLCNAENHVRMIKRVW